MDCWRKAVIYFCIFLTIAQMPGCNDKKNKSIDTIFSYFVSVGLLLSDSQAHDALIAGEIAVNNAYSAAPKPDTGKRESGSINAGYGLSVEYNWCKDANGDWIFPSTLDLTFSNYWVELVMYDTDADDIEFNGNCHVDLSGGDASQSLQKRIRHKIYVYLYYYPQPGSTDIIMTPAQSDYMITEIYSPVYSVCYSGSFAGRSVIPLVEPGGDGCLQ